MPASAIWSAAPTAQGWFGRRSAARAVTGSAQTECSSAISGAGAADQLADRGHGVLVLGDYRGRRQDNLERRPPASGNGKCAWHEPGSRCAADQVQAATERSPG